MAREWTGIQQFPLATQTKLLEILGTLKEKVILSFLVFFMFFVIALIKKI